MAKIGNLYSIETSKGKGYIQAIARITRMRGYRWIVRVLPGLYQEEPNLEELVKGDTKYYTPFRVASYERMKDITEFQKVGYFPIPEHEQKKLIFRGSEFTYVKSTGKYRGWVSDGENSWYREDLTEVDLKMSTVGLPNIALLIYDFEVDWHPALEMIHIED